MTMERRILCSPTWDTMEYSNCNFQLPKIDSARSSHDSYLDVAEGDSSACPHYTNHRTKSPHVLFQKVDSKLQSRERTIYDHESISLQVLQYTSESPPVVVSQPTEIKAKDVQAEDDALHHKHQNRQSWSAAAASEEKPTAKHRREQNRRSQQAFRQRRKEYVKNLSDELERLTEQNLLLLDSDSRRADEVERLKSQIIALNVILESSQGKRETSSRASSTSEMVAGFLERETEYSGTENCTSFNGNANNFSFKYEPLSSEEAVGHTHQTRQSIAEAGWENLLLQSDLLSYSCLGRPEMYNGGPW